MKVLVTIASRHGATNQIGDVVADVLEEAGFAVDRRAPEHVDAVDAYAAVVLGSAVYAGRWLGPAAELVERLAEPLAARPVWALSSGPLGDPPQPPGVPPGPDELVRRVAPRDHRVFAGAVDRDALNLAERAVVKVVKAPYGDFRDWDAVRAWALSIVDALAHPGGATSAAAITPGP